MNDFFKTLTSPVTAPGPAGSTFRDFIVAVSAIVVMLATLGILKKEQSDALLNIINVVAANWPALLLVGGTVLSTIVTYRARFKSRTIEGEAVAKAAEKALADPSVPEGTTVQSVKLETPDVNTANIVVPVPASKV